MRAKSAAGDGQHFSLFGIDFVNIDQMKTKVLALSIVAIILSFIGGFLLANALNRADLNNLRTENERLQNLQKESAANDDNSLGDEEITQKIAEADQNPDNFVYQKGLGIALYRYAVVKQDSNILENAARLLARAYQLDANDYDVIVALGNVNFDLALNQKDNQKFLKSREFYQKALEKKPKDPDVRTDLGLTYYLINPPETDQAVVEFQKTLQSNPNHEKTLQILTEVLINQNKRSEAEKFLNLLKQVNQNNESLPNLTAKLAQAKNEAEKQ